MHRRQPLAMTSLLCLVAALAVGGGCVDNGVKTPPSGDKGKSRSPAAPEKAFFVDMLQTSGIDAIYRNGKEAKQYAILESLGGGVGLIDYDQDGLLDIFFPRGGYFDGPDKKQIKGHSSRLYRNLGGWKFEDVTTKVGLDQPLFFTHGCAAADYDNDGWPDLLVTGYGRVALYHNESDGKGGRRFVDCTAKSGLGADKLWSTSAAWADFNGDGHADLYICHYVDWSFANHPKCKDYQDGNQLDVCPPRAFKGLPDALYLNNGNGTFRDASAEAGLGKDGKGLGVVVIDVNGDDLPDIYVANDTSDNFLYVNQGKARFKESALRVGVASDDSGTPNGSMGVDAADFDGSGWYSIFVTNYQHEAHALYRNTKNGLFIYGSRLAGITTIGLTYVGFGTCFLDYDRDGDEDIFITNGHVVYRPPLPGKLKQLPILFENLLQPGQKPHEVRFERVENDGGPYFRSAHWGRGAAYGDLDNDGKLDLIVSHMDEQPGLLHNRVDNGNHWLGIKLEGKTYRDAVGAKVTLHAGGRKLVRAVKGGGSYLSASDRRIVFGLGSAKTIERLTVRWPSGSTQIWQNLQVDRYWRLEEGKKQASS